MSAEKWANVENELNKIYYEIFKNENINDLDLYTKRKIIYDYFSSNIQYDYELLNKIKMRLLDQNYRVSRDPHLEIDSIFKYKKGICNAISQVYKLLLEKVGIYSLCVICDDGSDVRHQLNLVYDEENNTFSFDDITNAIINKSDKEKFFDYDMEDANLYNQGNKVVFNNQNWMCLPTDYIYCIVGREDKSYLKYNIEQSNNTAIPENIVSHKKTKHL